LIMAPTHDMLKKMTPRHLKENTFLEISLFTRRASSLTKTAMTDFFIQNGIDPFKIAYFEHREKLKAAVYIRSWSRVERIENSFRKLEKKTWKLKKKLLEREHWLEKWQRGYRISPLGTGFTVVPAWKRQQFRGKRKPVYIDPQGAFGSGTHETTQLMVRLMEKRAGKFETVFDAGVGTGILAIVASKLGARKVNGIDHDKNSIKASVRNLNRNRVMNAFILHDNLNKLKIRRQQYDLVTANLISDTLIKNRRHLASLVKKEGYLIVSGIYLKSLKDFLRDFNMPSLRLVQKIRGRSWTACLYKKI